MQVIRGGCFQGAVGRYTPLNNMQVIHGGCFQMVGIHKNNMPVICGLSGKKYSVVVKGWPWFEGVCCICGPPNSIRGVFSTFSNRYEAPMPQSYRTDPTPHVCILLSY